MIATVLVALAARSSQSEEVLNPAQRKIMELKQRFMGENAGDLCRENPLMAKACDACDDIGLLEKDKCCQDLMQFSTCPYQLMREWSRESDADIDNTISQMPEANEEVEDPVMKRYIARWGLTKGESPVQWGRPIKRYGMASGRRFNFNKFKEGRYAQKSSRK